MNPICKLVILGLISVAGLVKATPVLIEWSTAASVANPAGDGKYWNSLGANGIGGEVPTTALVAVDSTASGISVAVDNTGEASNFTGAGFGGTGIAGPTGPDPFDETNAVIDGIYANYNANGTSVITFSGLAPSTQYDFSSIGGRASGGNDGIIKVLQGTPDENAVDNDLLDSDDLLDSYTLLNDGTILDFSVISTDAGVIEFRFFENQNDTDGSSNAVWKAMSVVAAGPSGGLKVTSITKSADTVTIEFEGVDGRTYNLNKSTDLGFGVLDSKDTVTLSGTTTGTLEDTTPSGDAAFYRVEEEE